MNMVANGGSHHSLPPFSCNSCPSVSPAPSEGAGAAGQLQDLIRWLTFWWSLSDPPVYAPPSKQGCCDTKLKIVQIIVKY